MSSAQLVLLLVALATIGDVVGREDVVATLESSRVTNWGYWSPWAYCSKGTYAQVGPPAVAQTRP